MDLAALVRLGLGGVRRAILLRRAAARAHAFDGRTNVDDHHGNPAECIAELRPIGLVERLDHARDRPVGLDRHAHRVDLPEVRHIDRMTDGERLCDGIAGAHLRLTFMALLAHDLRNRAGLQLGDDFLDRARKVIAHVGRCASHRAEHAGKRRHQHRADADLLHQGGAMHRTRAAERHQREIAWIVPAFDRQQANAARHPLIDHGEDRLGGLLDAETKLRPKIPHRLARSLDVEAVALDANWPRRIDTRQHHVGVGHRRLRSAAAPAHRARIGAGALGSDLQDPRAIDMRDASAARPDRVYVDHRQAERQAEVQQRILGNRRLTLDHHCDVEAGAAHIAGDDAVEAGLRRKLARRHHARRRTRAHDIRGTVGQLAHRHYAAVRLHDQRLLVETPFAELLEQRLGVARHQRLKITLDHRRAGAFELVVFADYAAGDHEFPARLDLAQDIADALLMCRIGVGVQQRHHHRIDLLALEHLGKLAHLPVAQWDQHVAFVVETRHQRALDTGQPIHVRPVAPPKLQHVAEAARRDQRAARAAPFDHRVGGDRSAVQNLVEVGGLDVGGAQRVDQSDRGVLWRRRHLDDALDAAVIGGEIKVGVGPTDINADGAAHVRRLRVAALRPFFFGLGSCGSAIFLASAL